jgi:hypothetical protein
MKTLMVIALILGAHITTLSQNMINTGNDEGGTKFVEPHKIVVKNAGKKFSYYLPDDNQSLSVKKLESDFVAYNISNDSEDYESSYVVIREGKGVLMANYDSNGKLIRVEEKYYDTQLPMSIIQSVYKAYPGWQIVKDKYVYSQKNGEMTKREYFLKLKKENEIIKLKVNPTGDVIVANVD